MLIRECNESGFRASVSAVNFIDPGGDVVLRIQCDSVTDDETLESICADGRLIEFVGPTA